MYFILLVVHTNSCSLCCMGPYITANLRSSYIRVLFVDFLFNLLSFLQLSLCVFTTERKQNKPKRNFYGVVIHTVHDLKTLVNIVEAKCRYSLLMSQQETDKHMFLQYTLQDKRMKCV